MDKEGAVWSGQQWGRDGATSGLRKWKPPELHPFCSHLEWHQAEKEF